MRFPFREIHSLADVVRNFEQIEQQGIYVGDGAPTFTGSKGNFYFRRDTPTTANQRIYVCTGGATWTGIV